MHIELPSEEDAKFLGSRSVAIKGIFEPWGAGATCEECLEAAKVFPLLPPSTFPSAAAAAAVPCGQAVVARRQGGRVPRVRELRMSAQQRGVCTGLPSCLEGALPG